MCANQRLPNSRVTMSVHKRGIRLRTGCSRRPLPRLLRARTQRGLCLWRTRACALHEHVRLHHERHTSCDAALLRLSWPRASCAISFMLRVCLHRHRACARWSRLRSTRSQPSCFAADGAAPAITGGGAWGKARQTLEANKSAVGVAMQFLVMIDKLHDMHQRQVISDLRAVCRGTRPNLST